MEIIYENSDSRPCALSPAPPSAANGYFDAKTVKQWKSTKSVALTFPGDRTAKAFQTEILVFLVHFAIFALRISPETCGFWKFYDRVLADLARERLQII